MYDRIAGVTASDATLTSMVGMDATQAALNIVPRIRAFYKTPFDLRDVERGLGGIHTDHAGQSGIGSRYVGDAIVHALCLVLVQRRCRG